MKKRDLFWISRIACLFVIILVFSVMVLNNIIQFNTSYIQEEKDELNVFKRQIQWAVTPFLKNDDITGLQVYTADFEGEDVEFRIFDKDKQLLASSNPSNVSPMAKKDSKILRKKNPWKIYKNALKSRKILSIDSFEPDNSTYYIELTLSEEKVIGKIIKAQVNLIILFAICIGILLSAIFQLIYQVRSTFNKFDDSVLKIAAGELDTEIEIPKLKILEELAIAVKKMALRLKNQIMRLETLEEYKNEFIRNVSHEIKTPVTAINMALELSENSNNEEQNKECFNIIKYQTNSINKLVNDILMLSEIDIEKTSETKPFKDFSLNLLLEKVVNSLDYGKIKINISANEEVTINGDEDLLQSAIENLVVNAIKYSNSDKIDIILNRDENGVHLQIKDYGIGIKKEHLDKIFEKFYRIDKARSRKTGGTGLGLAIVKDIIELHNWTIEVESEINKGTNFIITIPSKN